MKIVYFAAYGYWDEWEWDDKGFFSKENAEARIQELKNNPHTNRSWEVFELEIQDDE